MAWGESPLAFPDFERFYIADFPAGTPIEVCCVYQFRHVRVNGDLLSYFARKLNWGAFPAPKT